MKVVIFFVLLALGSAGAMGVKKGLGDKTLLLLSILYVVGCLFSGIFAAAEGGDKFGPAGYLLGPVLWALLYIGSIYFANFFRVIRNGLLPE